MKFETKIAVRWADVDQNRHVRHSAYYDYGAHCRIALFEALDFGIDTMTAKNFGPVLFEEKCAFLKELHLNETVTVRVQKGEIRADGSRWELHHEIMNSKGEKAAHLTVKGAWMDLSARKLTRPPEAMAKPLLSLEQGEPFTYKKNA